jgi:hypothetical protein
MLRPFIVTYWSGRTLDDMPDDVWDVYKSAGFRQRHVNVALLALDSQGKLLRAYQPDIRPGDFRGDTDALGRDFAWQLDDMLSGLKLPRVAKAAKTKLTLPDVCGDGQPAGARIYLKFSANRINHYRTPTVEAVAMTDGLRKPLQYPTASRSLPASALRPWLEQIYPPAIMDGHGGMKPLGGTLTLRPAGRDDQHRYALLEGTVQFELDNQARTTYDGRLSVVLKYPHDSLELFSVRGVCDCTFEKPQPGRRGESIQMTAAIESRPE